MCCEGLLHYYHRDNENEIDYGFNVVNDRIENSVNDSMNQYPKMVSYMNEDRYLSRDLHIPCNYYLEKNESHQVDYFA